MGAHGISDATTFDDEDEDERNPPQTLPVGALVGGKYEIKRLLGMGGNGAVYEGEHTAVGHRVAIKVVHPKLTDREDIMARFSREARTCGSLRHPNVGQVYDVGALDDGAPYMVMELQDGRSLGDVLDETTLPIGAVVDITRQLLAGLGAAHQLGVIHRDVKPDNVMIVRDHSGSVVVKLVDFGISKRVGGESDSHHATGEGLIIGSPDYMPPEQLRGDAVDVRTDLYAVGVLLYEGITGRIPFDAENLADLVVSVMRDPITPPTQLRQDCPAELESIALKALSRDPAKRYQTASDMSRALAQVRASAHNLPPSNLARLSEPPARAGGARPNTRSRRKRTIDSRTLEGLRVQIPAAAWQGSRPALRVAVAVAVLLGAGALVWQLGAPSTVEEHVVATALPSERGAAQALAATPTPAPAPEAVPAATPAAAPMEPARALEPATQLAPVVVEAPAQPAREAGPSKRRPAVAAQDVQALLGQASSAFALGHATEARALYQQVVKLAPREAAGWRGLGVAATQLGARSEAVRAFQRYLVLRPGAPDAARVRQQLEALK